MSDASPTRATDGTNAAASAAARERRRGDRLAMASIVVGAAIALAGLRTPLTLATGCAVALAGVLLAVRGDRAVPAPALLGAALSLVTVSLVAVALLGVWQDWQVGQELADGAALALVQAEVRPWVRVAAALRSLSLFCGLALLLGAALTRLPDSAKPDSGK